MNAGSIPAHTIAVPDTSEPLKTREVYDGAAGRMVHEVIPGAPKDIPMPGRMVNPGAAVEHVRDTMYGLMSRPALELAVKHADAEIAFLERRANLAIGDAERAWGVKRLIEERSNAMLRFMEAQRTRIFVLEALLAANSIQLPEEKKS